MHVLHLSAASALPLIAAARADGVRVTAETCPHYLTLAAEEVPDGATAVQVLPADPGRGQPGRAVAAGWPTARSTAWCPTTRRARRS